MGAVARWRWSLALLGALAPAVLPAHGQTREPEGTAARPAVSPQLVSQKLGMVERILNQSALPQRVLASANETAQRHLANARELLVHAKLLVAAGEPPGADSVLNGAIWEIGRARQLVPDPQAREASERARTTQQEDRQMLEAATRLAGQTIVYDRRFREPRQEFDHELERHRSFERLVPIALERFRPGPEAVARIEQLVGQARSLRERGEAAAAADLAAGIRLLVESTDRLLLALQAAGLVVPQTMGSPK